MWPHPKRTLSTGSRTGFPGLPAAAGNPRASAWHVPAACADPATIQLHAVFHAARVRARTILPLLFFLAPRVIHGTARTQAMPRSNASRKLAA